MKSICILVLFLLIFSINANAEEWESSSFGGSVLVSGDDGDSYSWTNWSDWWVIEFENETTNITHIYPGWNIVSLPFNSTVNKSDIYFNISGTGEIYNWSEAVSNTCIVDYIYEYNSSIYNAISSITPGIGFWMYSYNESLMYVNSNITDLYNKTMISSGWNMFGFPATSIVSTKNITVTSNSEEYTFQEAVDNKIIISYIYNWSRITHYYDYTEKFYPGFGYLMYSYYNCTLSFEDTEEDINNSEDNWEVIINGMSDTNCSDYVVLRSNENGTNELDVFDAMNIPSLPTEPYLDMYIDMNGTQTLGIETRGDTNLSLWHIVTRYVHTGETEDVNVTFNWSISNVSQMGFDYVRFYSVTHENCFGNGSIPMLVNSSFTGNITPNIDYDIYILGSDSSVSVIYTSPSNNGTDISLYPRLSATIENSIGSTFNISWLTNSSGTWSEFGTNTSCSNGTYYQDATWVNSSLETYYWNVSVKVNENYTNFTFDFTTDIYEYNTEADYWSFVYSPSFSSSSEYPPNVSTDISRSPDNMSLYIAGSTVNVTFYFYNMTPSVDVWTEAGTFTDVTNSRVEIENLSTNFTMKEFLWGNTTYTWTINTTNSYYWINYTYTYTTKENASGANARYDVDNDNSVDVFDLNSVWSHRTGEAVHNDIYNVNADSDIDVFDLNTVWAGRS